MHEPVIYSYNSTGKVTVFGSSKSKIIFSCVNFPPKKLQHSIIWIGNGTAFEIENGTELIVASWVKSGPLRAGGVR